MRMRAGALDVTGADRWYVTDGAHSVGPVRLDLLTRGVEAGRVPLDSFVRHEAWKVWRPLTDFTDYVEETNAPLPQFALEDPLTADRGGVDSNANAADAVSVRVPKTQALRASLIDFASDEGVPSRSSTDGADVADGLDLAVDAAEQSANAAASVIPPPGSSWPDGEADGDAGMLDEMLEPESLESPTDVSAGLISDEERELFQTAVFDAAARELLEPLEPQPTDDIPVSVDGEEGWGSARPADSSDALPDDDLEGAGDLSDALLLLLGGVVKRTNADIALLFRTYDSGAKVVCAHGPGTVNALGSMVSLLDPAFIAAAAGHLVVGEPHPGPIARATVTRLQNLGVDVLSTLLMPISVGGRLFGFLELGKSAKAPTRTFSPREVVKAEDLVLAFARQIDGGFEI